MFKYSHSLSVLTSFSCHRYLLPLIRFFSNENLIKMVEKNVFKNPTEQNVSRYISFAENTKQLSEFWSSLSKIKNYHPSLSIKQEYLKTLSSLRQKDISVPNPIVFPNNPIPITISEPIVVKTNENFFNSKGFLLIFLLIIIPSIIRYIRKNSSSSISSSSFMGDLMKMTSSRDFRVQKPETKFGDIKGCEEAKEELSTIVDYLKNPQKYNKLGGIIPKGCLLVGPPGTGKTLLARAVAGEANVPFFACSGSEFEEVFVGVGSQRVRDLFQSARKLNQPCVIFIDELDAIGAARRLDYHNTYRQTLNQLLNEMDGFTQNERIIVIAATNNEEILDVALVRPGRFDKKVLMRFPNIIDLYLGKVKNDPNTDTSVLARGTSGLSGADLFNLINTAALKASNDNSESVTQEHLEFAKDQVYMGIVRPSQILSSEEIKLTAYHEAGHATIALLTEGSMPIHKVTIIPRGNSLGHTQQIPEGDKYTVLLSDYFTQIDVSLGGRAAEEIVFGAANDLKQANHTARAMVTHYGLSKNFGLLVDDYSSEQNSGKSIFSEETNRKIDENVNNILIERFSIVKQKLQNNYKILYAIAEALIENETLDSQQIKEILIKNQ